MVKVVIENTGEELDVIGRVGYTKQVSNIGDVGKPLASYSWTIRVLRTYKNASIFDTLGIVGSASSVPYREVKVSLISNGVPIVRKGNLQVIETNEKEYKCNIKEGVIDFFLAISNDKLGNLDLSELAHERSRANLQNTWSSNDPYRYFIASYNANLRADIDNTTNFDVTGLAPSVNVKWILDKIFETYGWEYTGLEEAEEVWMSYPSASDIQEVGEIQTGSGIIAHPTNMCSNETQQLSTIGTADNDYYFINFDNFLFVASGDYAIELPKARWDSGVSLVVSTFNYTFKVNGVSVSPQQALMSNKYYFTGINAGDVLEIFITNVSGPVVDPECYPMVYDGDVKVFRTGISTVDFSIPLMDYGISEFLKEIMIQTASIAITNVQDKVIDFITIEERVNKEVVVIHKNNYIRTNSERYIYSDYAQNNYLKHKYDEDGSDYNDGNIQVDNENAKIERDIFESKAYSPLRNRVIFYFGSGEREMPIFKMYDIEVKEDNDGNIEIEYKPLDERFYFMKEEVVNDSFYINDIEYSGDFSLGKPWTYRDIVNQNYPKIQSILSRSKVIECDLYIGLLEFANFEFDKVYYIEELAGYYLANRITYDTDKGINASFVKIDI